MIFGQTTGYLQFRTKRFFEKET